MNNDLKELINTFVTYYNRCFYVMPDGGEEKTSVLLKRNGCESVVADNNGRLSVTFPDDADPACGNSIQWDPALKFKAGRSEDPNVFNHGGLTTLNLDVVNAVGRTLGVVSYTESPTTDDKAKPMKDFNLEEAKAGKAVCTGNSGDARILCFDAVGGFPVIAALKDVVGHEYAESFDLNGVGNFSAKCDLFMKTERKEGWINIFEESPVLKISAGMVFSSEEKAHKYKLNYLGDRCLATVKVEWEE